MVVKRRLRDRADWHARPADPGTCPLCGRPLGTNASVDEHHLVPRSEGGTAKDRVHRICHRAIHATFTEKELARDFRTWEALRAHPAIAEFVRWVAGKPPDFQRRTATSGRKRALR